MKSIETQEKERKIKFLKQELSRLHIRATGMTVGNYRAIRRHYERRLTRVEENDSPVMKPLKV